MKSIKGFLELEKIMPLNIGKNENPELIANKILDELIERDKNNNSYLSTFEIYEKEFESIEEEYLVFDLVKKAIDSFDPYFVHPESFDEYDGESKRIGGKIKFGMSIDEIAEIMKEEFNYSFSEEFTREDFSQPARTVYNLLEDSLHEIDIPKDEGSKKVYLYIKLYLCKLVNIEELEGDGEEKLENLFSNKIKKNKESEDLLSFFKTINFWACEYVDV